MSHASVTDGVYEGHRPETEWARTSAMPNTSRRSSRRIVAHDFAATDLQPPILARRGAAWERLIWPSSGWGATRRTVERARRNSNLPTF